MKLFLKYISFDLNLNREAELYLFVLRKLHSDSQRHIIILLSIEGDEKREVDNEMVEFSMRMDEHGVI